MTLKNCFTLGFTALSLFACVPKDQTLTNAATASGSTSGSTSSASCTALAGYESMGQCKTTTSAQCFPSDKNIQGTTHTCYFPADGWQACSASQATWTYGPWTEWCLPTGLPPGIYQRSHSATCTKTVAVCDCATAAESTELCSIGNPFHPACTFTTPPTQSCSTTPTPIQTPVPTATPSQTARWCANAILSYVASNSDGAAILRDLNGQHYGDISGYFRAHGYNLLLTRSSVSTIPFIPVGQTELQNNYTVQVSATKSRCTFGNKVGIHVEIFQGNVAPAAAGYHSISQHSSYSACIHTGDVAGRMLRDAMDGLQPPFCN